MKLLTSLEMSLPGKAAPDWWEVPGLLKYKVCDREWEVAYSSVSYLTDTALKWKIMDQIQEAQDPCNGIALLQVFGSVTHVSSSISNKN